MLNGNSRDLKNTKFVGSLRAKLVLLSTFGLAILLVSMFLYVFPIYEAQVKNGAKKESQSTVNIAYGILNEFQLRVEKGELTKAEAQTQARNLIRKLRFNGTDYFFAYDFDGLCLISPVNPQYEGTNRIDWKDSHGTYTIREMATLAKSEAGEGFLEYSTQKVKDGPQIDKISFFKGFKPWGWYIGSGVYLDVLQAGVREFEMKVLAGFATLMLIVFAVNLFYSFRLSNRILAIVQNVKAHSAHVSDSISVLTGAGQSLSDSSSSIAASLQQTTASLEEVNSIIKLNSESASEAARISLQSQASVEEGEKEMSLLIQSMSDISESSKKIDQITAVIDDIAFQTNLLALNASIEAARAGEQGKGFAVVADAVRTLAQRSGVAAQDISHLIKASVKKVDEGAAFADRSGQVLKNISQSVKNVASLNREIASSSREQLEGVVQINQAMMNLDQSSQANAHNAKEISSNVIEIAKTTKDVDSEVYSLNRLITG